MRTKQEYSSLPECQHSGLLQARGIWQRRRPKRNETTWKEQQHHRLHEDGRRTCQLGNCSVLRVCRRREGRGQRQNMASHLARGCGDGDPWKQMISFTLYSGRHRRKLRSQATARGQSEPPFPAGNLVHRHGHAANSRMLPSAGFIFLACRSRCLTQPLRNGERPGYLERKAWGRNNDG